MIISLYISLLLRFINNIINWNLTNYNIIFINSSSSENESDSSIYKDELNKSLKRKRDETSENEEESEEDDEATLSNLKDDIKDIVDALALDKKLPENQKNKNSYVNKLITEKGYAEFFDEESGNTNVRDGLKDLYKELISEVRGIEKRKNQDSSITNQEKSQTPGDFVSEKQETEISSMFDDIE